MGGTWYAGVFPAGAAPSLRTTMTPRVKRLRSSCLNLWALLIFQESLQICPICNDEKVVDAHHLIGKVYWRRKCFWNKLNGLGVGRKCHKYPERIKGWIQENRPKQYRWLQRQCERIHTGPKPQMNEEQQIVFLKEIRKSLLKQL